MEQLPSRPERPAQSDFASELYNLDYDRQLYDYTEKLLTDSLETFYRLYENEPEKILRFINYLEELSSPRYHEVDKKSAQTILTEIRAEQESYLIKKKIDLLGQNDDRIRMEYNDDNLEKKFDVSQLESFNPFNQKKPYSVSKISPRFGIVYLPRDYAARYYNRFHEVRCFFSTESENPEAIDLRRVLTQEGYAKEDPNLNLAIDCYHMLIAPGTRNKIENEFGINLADFNLRTQIRFLNYLVRKNEAEIGRLTDFTQKFGEDGLQTFLACEYGADIPEKILALAENLEPALAQDIFSAYAGLSQKAEEMMKLINGFKLDLPENINGKLGTEIGEAILLRAKDLMLGLGEKAKNDAEKKEVETVIIAINGLEKLLDMLTKLNGDSKEYRVIRNESKANNYNFEITENKDEIYNLNISLRPVAEKHAQARINFELDFATENPNPKFLNAFEQKTIFHPNDPKRKKIKTESVLRLGIDLETLGRSPALSVDFGRDKRESADLIRTGDPLGNTLLEIDAESGHHTTSVFETEFAEPENFAKIVLAFEDYLASLPVAEGESLAA